MFSINQRSVIIAAATLFLTVLGYTYHTTQPQAINEEQQYRIAIFEPALHPAIEEIAQGFMDTMNNSGAAYTYKRFNAAGNKILMQAQAQEIARGDFDLIFTIGFTPSHLAKEACAKQHCTTPLVFAGVDDAQGAQLKGTTTTGVTERTAYREQLDLLVALHPTIKQVLLVYDPSQGSGLEKDKQEITTLLKEKSIALRAVEIQSVAEIHQKVAGFMPQTDVVMILKDHTAVAGVDSLITLCNCYHIPLFASDLNSGIKGAALAFGIREYDSGVGGARLAQQLLHENKKPADLAITPVQPMKMRINRTKMASQGLNIESTALPNNVELY